jgi:cytochrome P450
LQTMNETLRMVNVVTWFAGRTSEKDTQIKGKQAHYF